MELSGRSQATAPGRRGERSIDRLEAARREIADVRGHHSRYGGEWRSLLIAG